MKGFLTLADVTVGGSRPWDPQVHDLRTYWRVLAEGSIGAGESYMDGWWDCEEPVQLYERLLGADIQKKIGFSPMLAWAWFTATFFNLQTKAIAQKAIDAHYEDRNTRAFEHIYDRTMGSSCAYFRDGNENLETAQVKKYKLVCDKICLKPGDHLLDIGCGWGSLISYAAKERGAICTGITRSVSQAEYIRKRYKDLPIEVIRADYRDARLSRRFDAIASIEMFGHVGVRNYHTFFSIARVALKDDGLFLLQETLFNQPRPRLDPFVDKYIFPNAQAPTPGQASTGAEPYFVLEDFQNIGPMHYDTMMAWQRNMERSKDLIIENFGSRWYRMMTIYHTSCAAAFKTRKAGCGQFIFSPKGTPGGYQSVR